VPDMRPTSAGTYDYALGGTANTLAERRAVDAARRVLPELNDGIWANRGFVQRVRRMAADWGVRQFLDLGAGLPTQRNTHDVVAEDVPDPDAVLSHPETRRLIDFTEPGVRFHLRTKEQMERFFDGLEIVPPFEQATPAVTYTGLWGAEDPEAATDDGSRWFYAAVARKP
jgi:hypothetical protein